MGLLDSMFGDGETADANVSRFASERYEVTYTVSPESHAIAYALPVGESDLAALAALLEADDEQPLLTPDADVSAALDAAVDDEALDGVTIAGRIQRPRQVAETVLETWRACVDDDVDIAYLPIGLERELAAFVSICRERADRGDDPFELPERFDAVGGLLVRIKRASDRPERRVVVNKRHLPGFDHE